MIKLKQYQGHYMEIDHKKVTAYAYETELSYVYVYINERVFQVEETIAQIKSLIAKEKND